LLQLGKTIIHRLLCNVDRDFSVIAELKIVRSNCAQK